MRRGRPRPSRGERSGGMGGALASATAALELAEARVEITSIAAGGDGVGRADGRVLFVPRTAPGDIARVRYRAETSARFAHARLAGLDQAGAARVTPPCPHYVRDDCGGCQLQHLAYEAQLAAKAAIIHDAFARIAKRPLGAPVVVQPSPEPWRYRRKISLHLRRIEGGVVAGLHPYHDPSSVFALQDCQITSTAVNQACREIVAAADLLPHSPGLRATVREVARGVSLVIEGGTQWRVPAALLDRVPSLQAIWWQPHDAGRRLVADRRGDQEPGASFVQVNAVVAAALRAHVVARALALAPAHASDAYAGAGETALALAEQGVRVTAIELDRDASRYCAARLPAGSRSVTARVEDELPRALPADVVIVNPPREGVQSPVTSALNAAAGTARAIIYISCNPATLARDVARLPAWRVAECPAFDMFPHTAHVETVCVLVPETA